MSGYRIAVIGDNDRVVGFKALGLDVYPCEHAEQARSAFQRLRHDKDNVAIIYMTEELAQELEREIASVADALTPAVILIPSKNGTLGLGMSALQNAVERAVGADIL